MATLDIFNDDAFAVSQLSQTITDLPDVPTKLGDKGLFDEYGISTTSIMIERQGSSLKLIQTSPRGGVPEPVALGKRKLIDLRTTHLSESWQVLADEVQNVRAFGSETEVDQVKKLVQRKLQAVRDNMDLTLEYHRVGALKGLVLDADGSTILDVYAAFGMTQQTIFFNQTIAANAEPIVSIRELKRAMKSKLGGRSFTGIRVICSEEFFDDFVGSDKMEKAWALWNNGAYFRADPADDADFQFAKVSFEIYSGGTDGADFIPAGEAYAYPLGVPRMFQTAFAPADYMETVNTPGIPFYAKQEPMRMNKGVEGEAQSNPLTFNSLPEAVIKLKSAAS